MATRTSAAFPLCYSRHRWAHMWVGRLSRPAPSMRASQLQPSGGFWPFGDTQSHRQSAGDPRLSLEKRYGTPAGYVCVVTAAANKAVEQGFLLVPDAQMLISQATASNVLSGITPTTADSNLAGSLCSSPSAMA